MIFMHIPSGELIEVYEFTSDVWEFKWTSQSTDIFITNLNDLILDWLAVILPVSVKNNKLTG